MERLHSLLRDKVRREWHAQNASTTGPEPAVPEGKTKRCWLCGAEARLRYRLKDTSSLCFPCFRTAYIALVLPFIDTPQRRASDAATLRRIAAMAEERRAASPIKLDSSSTQGSTWDRSVIEPSQVSFVMSASRMRQRLQSNASACQPNATAASQTKTPTPPSPQPPLSQKPAYWNCPRCTYVNPLGAKRCEACDFANTTTVKCPHCSQLVPLDAEAAKAQKSTCGNGKRHVPWYCAECGEVNTLDGDACEHCNKERYWACTYCTAMHNAGRSKDGLRYCPTCGSYNTPEDVLKGQDAIDAEHKKAQRMASQQDPNSEVVFGVNDAQTLAEQQRQSEIAKNTERLNNRLDKLSIRRISQKSDGNCLFSALAHQLFGNQQLHYLVRSCVVAYMRENSSDYVILFDGEGEWTHYINQMKENGTWGDELCLNAAARCFCVNIHVITSDPERWHMVFQQDQLGKSETNLRDKLPNLMEESPIYNTPHSASRTSRGVTGPPSGDGSTTLSLFIAYLFPVHFDDVTPTEVPAVVLSDLMIPELHKMLRDEGYTAPLSTAPASTAHRGAGPPEYDLGFPALAGATLPAHQRSSLHSEQHQSRRGSAVATSPTVERPPVPRVRGPNSSPPPAAGAAALEGPRRPPPPPPSHRPPSARSDKTTPESHGL